ncbi:MAG: DUF2207 domain-containing protein [Sphaerochaetaceae bacterium]|nr:DUF2207 domain-containing protein [Sphaerochaetaceae bacterium]MDD3163319.1 DUF2207 domain-containing protein [Sphaerochaetaceae bacterium]MDD4007431.1 DUF2207 domain-containing protein [Sphaerochaetaceae bacterium]MDD4396592.1 DUF2207 domain-containing protein [Sphaerochaetaceae bacterium]
MRSTRIVLIAICIALACGFSLGASDYSIHSYEADIKVQRNAVLSIAETIDAEFYDPMHGIYREIPVGYLNGQRAIVTDLKWDRTGEIYESSKNYINIRFGEEDVVLTGPQSYNLSYDYDIGADQNEGYDELYYNLVGEGWQVELEKCTFNISFPSEIDSSRIWVTRGQYGSESSEGTQWSMTSSSSLCITAYGMQPGEELTVRVELPDGYYQGAREIVNKTPMFFWLTVAGCLIAIGAAALIWMKFGKDKVPVFYASSTPPEGMTPVQMGYLADFSVDDKDITSMLFYWADKGLLKIDRGGKKKDDFSFTKVRDIGDDALSMEKYLFDSFFECGTDGVVTEEDLEHGFYEKMEQAKAKVKEYYKGTRSLKDSKSQVMQAVCIFIGLIPLVLSGLLLTWDYVGFGTFIFVVLGFLLELVQFAMISLLFSRWYSMKMPKAIGLILTFFPTLLLIAIAFIGSAISDAVALQMAGALLASVTLGIIGFFAGITERRSDYGQKVLEQVLGYREFLEKVEMDKLKLMIDSDPELFYRNLSYAIVLGLEDKWARKFSSIRMDAPIWYTGNDVIFDAIFYSHMARSWNTKFQTVVMPKSTSSGAPGLRLGGSSFGGSGFSGGGFGGGGGGGW